MAYFISLHFPVCLPLCTHFFLFFSRYLFLTTKSITTLMLLFCFFLFFCDLVGQAAVSFLQRVFFVFFLPLFLGVSPACALLFFFYLLWTRQNLRINHERFNSWPSLCFVTEGSIGGQCLRGGTHCCGGNTRWTVCR